MSSFPIGQRLFPIYSKVGCTLETQHKLVGRVEVVAGMRGCQKIGAGARIMERENNELRRALEITRKV